MLVMSMGAYSGDIPANASTNTIAFPHILDSKETVIIEYDKLPNNKYFLPRTPAYDTRVELVKVTTQTIKGYLGNQLPGGRKFPTGGGFYYSTSGGPTASVSISLALPYPFNSVTFSANLGNLSNPTSAGSLIFAPNTIDYFKLFIERNYEITVYATYAKPFMSPDSEWGLLTVSTVGKFISEVAYAVKV